MTPSSTFFVDALQDNNSGIAIRIDALVRQSTGGRAVVPCRGLDIEEFARLEQCNLRPLDDPRAGSYRYWGGEDHDRLYTRFEQVIWKVEWSQHQLEVIHVQWETGCGGETRTWVVADTVEIAEGLILDVERKTHAPGESILVFSNGRWNRSRAMYQATQAASFDDLVLADDMKNLICQDFRQFLGSEEQYRRLGISWRRGALMIGPPGNGKTHCVRALIKELGVPSLYVQSLRHQYLTSEQMWQQVFERARGLRPCVLVLEDLDSLVDEDNRSFFLNQLDGFEQNHGLIVLATTNYPENIDSAIIDRPSRFDRKYHFDLPKVDERNEYLMSWQQQLSEETGWASEQVEAIAAATEGFSFAYLKELIISSVMQWMNKPGTAFHEIATEQATLLFGQMKTETVAPQPTKQHQRKDR